MFQLSKRSSSTDSILTPQHGMIADWIRWWWLLLLSALYCTSIVFSARGCVLEIGRLLIDASRRSESSTVKQAKRGMATK